MRSRLRAFSSCESQGGTKTVISSIVTGKDRVTQMDPERVSQESGSSRHPQPELRELQQQVQQGSSDPWYQTERYGTEIYN